MATVTVKAKIPREHRERLAQIAAAGDRSLSAEIRRAVRYYLDAQSEHRRRLHTDRHPEPATK